ncbi:MAG TPA: phage holin family protein [Lacipirellulaceae bacterium]|nr:phage holin family protein [Lacipirellulaceae bacterium]
MITDGRLRPTEPNVATSFSELAHDVIELAELQSQLMVLDVKNAVQKTRSSVVLAVTAFCIFLGSIPVGLFALAQLFVLWFDWPQWAGFGLSWIVGLVISACIGVGAWFRFRSGPGTMERSREELTRNIAWIKSSLRSREPTAYERQRKRETEVARAPH